MASEFRINKEYAEKYNIWRGKEELQKLKTRYGEDADLEDSSSSDTEDEDAEALTPQVEKDWLKTLAALKNKDPRIYDKNVKFYHDETSSSSDGDDDTAKKKKNKDKPMYLKDYERKLILEKEGVVDEESDDDNQDIFENKPGYYEEQEEIKKSFKLALDDSESDEQEEEEGLLKKRKKTKEDQEKEEQEYLQWLKGRKQELSMNENIVSDLVPLKTYWSKPDLDAGEKFLRDYILNKRYVDDDDNDRIPTYDEIVKDEVDFSEEEQILEKQEGFERKYNFRFEEPDEDFIKSYPRTIQDTLRRKDSRRTQKRQDVKERKKIEKEKKKEELRQLKNLKKKEIMSKLEKIKEITGNSTLAFSEQDMDADFDPENHDKMMQQTFDDGYYGGADEDTKPVFSDDEEYGLQVENWDMWEGNDEGGMHEDYAEEEPRYDDPNFNMDADYDPNEDRSYGLDGKTKKKKKSKFKEALLKKKPVFDPEDTTFEKYFDDYYKLDYEDIVGDQPCRFNYRKTVANDFGLSTNEILQCKDRELNAWVSLKKMSQYRTEEEETSDVNIFQRKSHNMRKKLQILTTLKEDDEDKRKAVGSKKSPKKNPEATVTSADIHPMSHTDHGQISTDNSHIDFDTKSHKRKIESSLDSTISKKVKIDSINTNNPSNTQTKKKKKKGNRDVSESQSVTVAAETNVSNTSTEISSAAGSKIHTGSDLTKSNKQKPNKKKQKHRKKPTISDERLKAYGINPKKFKYMDKSKLQYKPK